MHRQVNGLDLLLVRSVQGKIRRTLISENARHLIITNRYKKITCSPVHIVNWGTFST